MTTCLLQLDHVRTVGICFFGPFSKVPCNKRVAFSQDVPCQLHICIGSWNLKWFPTSKNRNCPYPQERIVPVLQVERSRPISIQEEFIMYPLLLDKLNEWLFYVSHSTRLWTYKQCTMWFSRHSDKQRRQIFTLITIIQHGEWGKKGVYPILREERRGQLIIPWGG